MSDNLCERKQLIETKKHSLHIRKMDFWLEGQAPRLENCGYGWTAHVATVYPGIQVILQVVLRDLDDPLCAPVRKFCYRVYRSKVVSTYDGSFYYRIECNNPFDGLWKLKWDPRVEHLTKTYIRWLAEAVEEYGDRYPARYCPCVRPVCQRFPQPVVFHRRIGWAPLAFCVRMDALGIRVRFLCLPKNEGLNESPTTTIGIN